MKKIIALILISLFCYTGIYAKTEKQLFDEGVFLFKQGHFQQAVDSFSDLIKLAPDNADAFKNRGVSYMKQHKFDLAISDFEKAKELFPELKGLYSNLGVAWYYKKDYKKAIENYNLEIQMSAENPVAYFNRALCLAELGRNKEALKDLEETLKLQPDFYWAICYKADLLQEQKDYIKAIEAYKEAIKLDPENTYASEKLALAKKKIKKTVTIEKKPAEKKDSRQVFTLQAGAFHNQNNADKLKKKIHNKGFDSRILILKDSREKIWYMVRSGNYVNRNDAKKASISFKKDIGIKPVIRPKGTW